MSEYYRDNKHKTKPSTQIKWERFKYEKKTTLIEKDNCFISTAELNYCPFKLTNKPNEYENV